jgi:tRNA(fMet)-specific endonuclease VapC
MTRYMLDNNTSSHILKGTTATRKHLTAMSASQILVSAITEGELLYGLAKFPASSGLRTAVHEFLLLVEILPWDSDAATRYGLLRAAMERKGKPLGNLDMLIAAHALAAGAVLVTNDKAFDYVDRLKITDWSK